MMLKRFILVVLMWGSVMAADTKPKPGRIKARTMPRPPRRPVLASKNQLKEKTFQKIQDRKPLNRLEKKEVAKAELETYKDLRKRGFDEVSNTAESAMMRNYRLRNKKKRGFILKKEASLAAILFPGMSPEEYEDNEQIWMYADLVDSKKTQIPYEFYDLHGCPKPIENPIKETKRTWRNFGARLQDHFMQPAPFEVFARQNKECTVLCKVRLDGKELRWMRRLIERQYRVQLQLDGLPVLMRSKELNYAVRGYPVGFKAPLPSGKARPRNDRSDVFVYNHLKFAVTYHEDRSQFEGIRITGFDVHPVSIAHDVPTDPVGPNSGSTCRGFSVENDPTKYLRIGFEGTSSVDVVYSYDILWIPNDMEWTDRWDVYLVGALDDDIRYYSIFNSLMIVLFTTYLVASIMIRILRKDVVGYCNLQTIEEAKKKSAWKLVHGDVFRPPSFSPMLLSVFVGIGAQLGCSVVLALLLSTLRITNSICKRQTFASLILLYVLCGPAAGYISARIYKFEEAKNWKINSFLTATALPGVFVIMFSFLNIFLTFAGAATAVSFWTILVLLSLWVCISAPLVFVGTFIGLKAPVIEVPTKTNETARFVPENAWYMNPGRILVMGGILPFGSAVVELYFIMHALWHHEIYFAIGFLLAVVGILVATCAQVSIVMCYSQLCAEDHRWWWKSFLNCAMAGVYLFLYSLWFLRTHLDLVGILPVTVYLTYMSMISICFGLFCGSVGFLASLWFTRTIYRTVKVEDDVGFVLLE